MNHIFDIPQMAERIESLKAGVISGISIIFAFLATTVINTSLLDFQPSWLISTLLMGFSGFLFGVTYRYIIRNDHNPHLKSGAIMAFGLVRGLAEIDSAWKYRDQIQNAFVLAGESIFYFAIAATILNFAIQKNWIRPFLSSD
jgi:hypothetical protein